MAAREICFAVQSAYDEVSDANGVRHNCGIRRGEGMRPADRGDSRTMRFTTSLKRAVICGFLIAAVGATALAKKGDGEGRGSRGSGGDHGGHSSHSSGGSRSFSGGGGGGSSHSSKSFSSKSFGGSQSGSGGSNS